MRRRFLFTLLMSAMLGFSANGFAADRTDFSGTYTAIPSNGSTAASPTTLRVVQNNDTIEITRESSKTTTSRFPLNGSEGSYTSPGGISGKGKVQFKGKNLAVESVVLTNSQPNSPAVRLRTKERWQLSADGRVLTIRFNVDFPDLEQLTHGVTDQSWTETYTHNAMQ